MSVYKAFAYHKGEHNPGSYGYQGSATGSTAEEAVSGLKRSLRTGLRLSEGCRPQFPVQIKVWQLVETCDGVEAEDILEAAAGSDRG